MKTTPEDKQTHQAEEHTASPTAQPPNSQLRDKRVLPEGVVPKQAQGYVIAGLSVMILMAVMFSKNHARPANAVSPSASTIISTDANARKIEELKESLSAEQTQSQRQAQAQKPPVGHESPNNVLASGQAVGTATTSQAAPAESTESHRDPIADAERELAFKARFASNLIVSADARAPRSPAEAESSTDVPPVRSASVPSQTAASQNSSSTKPAPEVNLNSAHGQPFVLSEGTTIDTVLTNRLDGEFAGPVKVMVSNPIYSHDRQHVLIPEGTFILGDVQKVSGFGQKRLAVVFHRLLMPDGYSVDLDQFHGLDQIGDTGLKDKVNNHYLQIFGASIALGIIAGAAESSTSSGYNQSGSDSYRQGISFSLSQSSANVLDKFINVLPTITIREGHRIKVYLTQDMLLPACENHSMPGVF